MVGSLFHKYKKIIGLFLLIVIIVGVVVNAYNSMEVTTTTIDCSATQEYGIQVISDNPICTKFSNKLGMNRGVFVDVSDNTAIIVSNQYFDIYEKRHSELEKQTFEEMFEGKQLNIHFYRMDSWDGEGDSATDNQTIIYSSFKLEDEEYVISGLGPFKEIGEYTKSNEEKAHNELVEDIKKILIDTIK